MNDKLPVIYWNMDKKEMHKIIADAAKKVQDDFKSKRWVHVGSWLISNEITENFFYISSELYLKLSEILADEKLLLHWNQLRIVCETFFKACEYWQEAINYNVMFSCKILNSDDVESLPLRIAEDLSVFGYWSVMNGASPTTYRKFIKSKQKKQVEQLVSKIGHEGVMAMGLRGAISFMVIDDKFVKPAIERMKAKRRENAIKKRLEEHHSESAPIQISDSFSSPFNGFASALKAAKKASRI